MHRADKTSEAKRKDLHGVQVVSRFMCDRRPRKKQRAQSMKVRRRGLLAMLKLCCTPIRSCTQIRRSPYSQGGLACVNPGCRTLPWGTDMPSARQTTAARKILRGGSGRQKEETIAHLPKATRTALGKQAPRWPPSPVRQLGPHARYPTARRAARAAPVRTARAITSPDKCGKTVVVAPYEAEAAFTSIFWPWPQRRRRFC